MRAKRATFTFEWTEVNQNAKNGPFWRVFENLKLVVKKSYQTGHFEKIKNWWKIQKIKCDILSNFLTK